VLVLVSLAGCAVSERTAIAPRSFADGHLASALERDIAKMEDSTPEGWDRFADSSRWLDGENGETFAVACAYLIRRDPTIFLRRYLAGDERAIFCGREAYGWSAPAYRETLDSVYHYRLLEARACGEELKIKRFIAETTR
jgi:hypothetical protein